MLILTTKYKEKNKTEVVVGIKKAGYMIPAIIAIWEVNSCMIPISCIINYMNSSGTNIHKISPCGFQ